MTYATQFIKEIRTIVVLLRTINMYLKVHPDVKLEGLVMQMLDASGDAADWDTQGVADEGGGGAIGIGRLHQTQLELSL